MKAAPISLITDRIKLLKSLNLTQESLYLYTDFTMLFRLQRYNYREACEHDQG